VSGHRSFLPLQPAGQPRIATAAAQGDYLFSINNYIVLAAAGSP
jgi:hypothetical protein